MENYQYSYSESVNSSPRSRDVDENASWDEPPSSNNYKVKFLCSYGGKIHPRPHDNQLTYVSGDTKILAVERNIRFATLLGKLSSLCDYEVCFKYQLPEEDLDALISVTNDEDLEHMMAEYDRLHRGSAKPARLRLFLFPVNTSVQGGFGTGETKSERQWFVDALNSVQIQPPIDESSPKSVAASNNPDFLFGLDKGGQPAAPSSAAPNSKLQDPPSAPAVPEVLPREILANVERHEPVVSPVEIQRQMEELQRLQLTSQEKPIYQKKSDEANPNPNPNPWGYGVDYYSQKPIEQLPPPQTTAPLSAPTAYWPERHMSSATYQAAPHPTEQPMYLIQTPAGIFHSQAIRPPTSQVSQQYYGMQRTVQDLYRDQTGYSTIQPPSSIQLPKVGGGGGISSFPESYQMVRPQLTNEQPSYPQAMYDGSGRQQVYYTTSAPPQYQTVSMQTMPNAEGKQDSY